MLTELVRWKEHGRDWDTGCNLFNQYGTDKSIKFLISLPKNPSSEILLLKAINKLIEEVSWDEQEERTAPAKIKQTKLVEEEPTPLPQDINLLIARRKKLYKEAGDAHAKLRHIILDSERFELARLIIKSMKENNKLWEAQDYYERHNHLPPNTKENPIADADLLPLSELLSLRNTLPPSISRDRKTLKTLTDPDKIAVLQERIDSRHKLLLSIKQRIKNAAISA